MLHTTALRAFAAVCLSALALSACSSQSSTSEGAGASVADTAERGPITFAMGKNDTDKLQPIIAAWNEAHPEEKVTLKELAGESDTQHDTLVQSLQAGNSDYDVMALDVVWTAEFAAHQWLTPLTGDLAVDTSGLLSAPVASATYRNTLYALPQNTNGQLLFRNTTLIPDAPTTWDDLVHSCASMHTSNTECLITQLKQYEGLAVNTADFINGWGGSILDAEGTPTVDSSEAQAGLTALVDAVADKTITSSSLSATEEETNLSFTAGEVAYAVNWPYMYANAEKSPATAGKVEVSPLVGKDGVGSSTLGGYNNGIAITSHYKATAHDFIEFIVSEENQRSFAEASFPPALASLYDDPTLIAEQPYLPALKESLDHAVPRPVTPFYTAVSKAIQDNAYAAITGTKTVEDATRDMKAAIESASH